MSVIRMIKLFGWEPRIAAQLNEKRERELVSVKKNRLYDLANDLCKCVIVAVAHHWQVTYRLYSYLIPIIIMLATFSTYVSLMTPCTIWPRC